MEIAKERAKAAVLEYLKNNPRSGYADLERVFDECGITWQGSQVICSRNNPNVVFWCGWSKAAGKILNELMRSGDIVREMASPIEYLTAGKGLSMPLATQSHHLECETERWLPVVFSLSCRTTRQMT